MLAAVFLSFAMATRAQPETAPCWTVGRTSFTAVIDNPAENFSILYEPMSFASVCGAGEVVVNGTFFAGDEPLGDVIAAGAPAFRPRPRRFRSGSHRVDLGARWGIGLLKGTTVLSVADGDEASGTMRDYLGGAGLLLKAGAYDAAKIMPVEGEWSASFSRSELEDERARTAVGLRKTADGRQQLIVLALTEPPGASIARTAEKMKAMGATDAVFYEGGGAAAFAAGGQCIRTPGEPGKDVSPTHIVIKACR